MSTRPTVLLVGLTGYGAHHLSHLLPLHEEGRILLRDAVVINPEQAAAALARLEPIGTRIHPAWDQALFQRDPPDLVCLPVGIPAHRPLTEQALALGANVLLEKPATGCVADLDALCAAEAAAPGWVTVGYQHMHQPAIQACKRRLLEGAIGDLTSLHLMGRWPRGDVYYQRNRWAARERVDGVVVRDSPANNAFAHFLNLGLFFAGTEFDSWAEVESVEGDLLRIRPGLETFDTCSLRFALRGGIPFHYHVTHACRVDEHPRLRLEGTHGWEEWRFGYPDLEHRSSVNGVSAALPLDSMALFRDVVERVAKPEVFTCTLADAGAQVRAVDLLHRTLAPHPMPANVITRLPANGQHLLPGLEEGFEAAYARGCLLREVFDWPGSMQA